MLGMIAGGAKALGALGSLFGGGRSRKGKGGGPLGKIMKMLKQVLNKVGGGKGHRQGPPPPPRPGSGGFGAQGGGFAAILGSLSQGQGFGF